MSQSIVGSLRRWDPEHIGPYAIIGRLGAGAMGQVFLARSTAGRLVAIKTIRVELAEEPGFRARFAREVAAARRVSGVFTAAVVEADPEADLPWLATAYVPAPTLSTLVRRCGPLPVPAVRWLAAGCAEALQSIHSAGLLHRDVKPSNVLVAPDGPRVIDFGVARAAERVQLTVTRGAAGTPAYMAPEQARDTAQASPASDVFSLGATLVFAAAGHPPYRGETVMDVLVRLATEPPDLTGVPDELAALVAACLARVPRDRPSDAAILARLGAFDAVSAKAGPGHSYLPDSAMAMIVDYQHNPQLTGQAVVGPDDDATGESTDSSIALSGSDGTAGSHTALPGFHSVPDRAEPGREPGWEQAEREPGWEQAGREPGWEQAERESGWEQAQRERTGQPRARPRLALPRGRPLAWVGLAAVVVLLVAAGTALGALLRGPVGSGDQDDGGLPPNGPPPSLCPNQQVVNGSPQLCVGQPTGDGRTEFAIHGSGLVPDSRVTVKVAGDSVSPATALTDYRGSFNYVIDQGHHFWPGLIPVGTWTVVVTAPDGVRLSTSFSVSLPGQPPPGGGPPGPP